jgi:hypothetical protein
MATRSTRQSSRGITATIVIAIVIAVGYWLEDGGYLDFTDSATAEPGDLAPGEARDHLESLEVRVEDTGHHYDRDDWPHWSNQGDGCDTRQITLQRDGDDVVTDDNCRAVAGSWYSPFDEATVQDSRDIDIDHVVPLAEANRSHTRHWDENMREQFANDPINLIAVTASSNRAKGDADPHDWRPVREYWCEYATRWVQVKATYELSVDRDEQAALTQMLATC